MRALFACAPHRIHFDGADGAKHFLRFGQAGVEFGEFAGRRGAGGAFVGGQRSNWDFILRDQVQLDEQPKDVRQVADEPAKRPWEFFDERRGWFVFTGIRLR